MIPMQIGSEFLNSYILRNADLIIVRYLEFQFEFLFTYHNHALIKVNKIVDKMNNSIGLR